MKSDVTSSVRTCAEDRPAFDSFRYDGQFFGQRTSAMRARVLRSDAAASDDPRLFRPACAARRSEPGWRFEYYIRAAGTAPSGANLQPWHFVAVSDPAIKRQI